MEEGLATTSAPATSADVLRHALETRAPVTVLDIGPAGDRAEWWIPGSMHLDAYGFARWLLGRIPATPPNHYEILRLNQSEAVTVDLEALEAGANRCSVS